MPLGLASPPRMAGSHEDGFICGRGASIMQDGCTLTREIAKKIVVGFLEKTIVFAENHIAKISNIEGYPVEVREYRQKRLEAWKNYIEFQKYTLGEIQEGKLDAYFDDLVKSLS
ncbi:MAG: hypothetical protein RML34_00030 [Leptospiraceae bacterium]|nr:hypothetical protein [Leptospiraceae bacterium]